LCHKWFNEKDFRIHVSEMETIKVSNQPRKVFCDDLSGSLRTTLAYIHVAEMKPARYGNYQEKVFCVDLSG